VFHLQKYREAKNK